MNFEILCSYGYCKQFTPPDYGLVTIDKETKIIRSITMKSLTT